MSQDPSPEKSSPGIAQALPPKPPFVLGITGNVDPIGYVDARDMCDSAEDMIQLKAKIVNILDWITLPEKRLNPKTGILDDAEPENPDPKKRVADPWRSLSLTQTPILVLSSLAPGADTIVAETVLEYAKTHPHVSLAAPLPFPPDIYERTSTFGEKDATKIARYHSLLAEIKAQPTPGFIFGVALDNDLMPQGKTAREAAEADLKATDPDFDDKPRRRLRYRAAGEYIAVHSDLLIAIQDEPHDLLEPWEKSDPPQEKSKDPQKFKRTLIADIFEAGTATIVEAKRRGLTHELLAMANNFAWADNGPVLLIPVRRRKRDALPVELQARLPQPGPMRFLHPYDLKPETVSEADDQHRAWQEIGDTRFRRVIHYQDRFNRLPEDGDEKKELVKLTANLSDQVAKEFAAALDPIARIRSRATIIARKLEGKRTGLLKWMFGLIFSAAFLYGCFEHWHHIDHKQHEGQNFFNDSMLRIQILLLAGTFLCLYYSGRKYFRHIRSEDEEDRFDYRAIGEALRVQFFWKLAGTGRSVAADYMQRQRDELDWIRYVVSSISMPHETTREAFLALPRTSQVQLLEATRKNWIGVQIIYFVGTAEKQGNAQKKENLAHMWHSGGRALASAGLLCMFLMLLAKSVLPLKKILESCPCQVTHWLIWPGLLLLGYAFYENYLKKSPHSSGHQHSGHGHGKKAGFKEIMGWVFGSYFAWGSALVLAGVTIGASFFLGKVDYHYLPDAQNCWIIFTGTLLLGGALCVAWAERNFYAEEARQYRAMGNLFTCADRRLQDLITRYAEAPATGPAADRILFEIHDILHQLGCEALDENAEWLIQHRARPLEMLMAG